MPRAIPFRPWGLSGSELAESTSLRPSKNVLIPHTTNTPLCGPSFQKGSLVVVASAGLGPGLSFLVPAG